jgi:predicted nuclease with TOPRIM domain
LNPKINKLRAELEKNNEKMEKLQARNAELQQQLQEAENLEILGMVRACGMSVEEIVQLLKAAGGGQE